jgi:GAF domain-containing protein
MEPEARWAALLRAPGSASGHVTTEQVFELAVQLGLESAPGITVGCSITELDSTTGRTVSSSGELATAIDRAQYDSGEGPCLTAAREDRVEYLRDIEQTVEFPRFAQAALGREVRSSLSTPLPGTRRPAALNIYAAVPDAFDDRLRAIARLLVRAVAHASAADHPAQQASSPRMTRAQEQARLLNHAQAVAGGGTSAQGFLTMARRSSVEKRSIFDVATEIVRDAQGSGETSADRRG